MHRQVLLLPVLMFLLLPTFAVQAADDPSIKGKLRTDIQTSMRTFIDHQTVDGVYRHYDPVAGKLLALRLEALHEGIVKKGEFYVSCADFVDAAGNKLDLDFLVLPADGSVRTTQALVHKVAGTKRPYDLEGK